jgi:enamine deaminase RidA (YjgF/YER057c/UK114 family)
MSTPAEAQSSAATAPASAVEQRLAELGITLPEVAAPVASYVPAVVSGSHVYTSGQLPFINGKLEATGKVSGGTEGFADEPTVSPEDAQRYAAVCAVNALAAVKSVIGDLDRITRIVKVVGFVASDPTFTGQPAVVNGASELLGRVLGDAGQHARSAVGVAVLPLDSPVEVELIAEFS